MNDQTTFNTFVLCSSVEWIAAASGTLGEVNGHFHKHFR